MTLFKRVILLVALFAILEPESNSEACNYNTQWQGTLPRAIGVWVTNGESARIGLTDAALGTAISRAVSIWNEESGADVKLYYAGITPNVGQEVVQDAITVHGYPHSGQTECDGSLALSNETVVQGLVRDGEIAVWGWWRPGGSCLQITWQQDKEHEELGNSFTNIDLISTLVHELGHTAYLMDHPANCGDPGTTIAVMISNPYTSRNRVPRLWDKFYARGKTPDRASLSTLYWNTLNESTLTWSTTGTQTGTSAWYRLGSVTYAYLFEMLGWAEEPTTGQTLGAVRYKYYSGGSFFSSQVLANQSTGAGFPNPVALAADSSAGWVLAVYKEFTGASYFTSDSYEITVRLSQDNGQTFATESRLVAGSVRYGLTAGFDPLTKTFLIAWPLDNGQLRVASYSSAGRPYSFSYMDLNAYSWHAPSVACSGQTNGCRLVWEDRTANGCLTWAEGYVDSVSFNFVITTTRQQCYYQYDTPSVSYYPKDSSYRLLFGQGNAAIYSYTMSSSGTSWSGTGDAWNSSSSLVSFPASSTQWQCIFGCTGAVRAWFLRFL